MELFVLVVGCFAAGIITRNIDARAVALSRWLNIAIINLIFPAIILSTVPSIHFDHSTLFLALSPWLGCLIYIPVCLWLSKKMKFNKALQGVLILLSILGNTAFLGIGMVGSFFGDESVPSAIIYDQLGTFLILAILGAVIIPTYASENHSSSGTTSQGISVWRILRNILFFPPFICFVLALIIPPTEIHGASINVMDWIGSLIVPLSLFVIGLQMELRVDRQQSLPIILILSLKMILLPAITLCVAMIIGVEKSQSDIATFQAAMPPMVTPALMLIHARIAPKFVASVLCIGTLASFITLPIWSYVLSNIV